MTEKATELDHEKLHVYHMGLEFVSLAHGVMERLPRGRSALSSQSERAATSIVLNIAEGSGEFSPKEKVRFYRMALRSTMECAAILDVRGRLGGVSDGDAAEGKKLLAQVASMLVGLVHRHRAK